MVSSHQYQPGGDVIITEKLARFVIDTRTGDIPKDVLKSAQDALVDTVGVALAGTLEPFGALAVRWVTETGAKAQASLWGQNISTSPAEAAFSNGMCAHALHFDDSIPTLRGHPSATMVPAALAVAEVYGASGAQVLAAYALGLEVADKLGRAIGQSHYLRGWHATATIGAFSSTAVTARLWALSSTQLQTAWGSQRRR